MALLSAEDRARIQRGLMRATAMFGSAPSVEKSDLLDAIIATDQWIETNSASFNASLPTSFRANATASQKTILLCAVALARVGTNFLQMVFGGVD